MPTAFITGITGQDGSYLAELLLDKGYEVVGLISSKYNIGYENIESFKEKLKLEDGDLLDAESINSILDKHQPDEVYNLAGLTFVPASWERPTLTLDINLLGVSRIVESLVKNHPDTKFFQANSARMFGNPKESPQNEETRINPKEPYSVSKSAAHQLVQVMRNHFGLFGCNGIMYNHESERRGPEFVTRKITQAAVKIKKGQQDTLELGDLDATQDWGYAPDYVEAMWLMLQADKPDDYVIASGQYHSVRDICRIAFEHLDLNYEDYVTINPKFIRAEKVDAPLGDASKAEKVLNWKPRVSFDEMIVRMVEHDLHLLES